jgi:hypothetical protein
MSHWLRSIYAGRAEVCQRSGAARLLACPSERMIERNVLARGRNAMALTESRPKEIGREFRLVIGLPNPLQPGERLLLRHKACVIEDSCQLLGDQ